MEHFYKQEAIRKIISPNGEFICLLEYNHSQIQGFDPKATLYKVVNKDIIYQKALFGDGIFLNDTILLLFVNPSGYGPCEGDCYLYDISSDKICPLYDDNLDALLANNKARGEFIALESNILVTPNLLILKTLFSGIFFYNKHEIFSSRKLELIYCLPKLIDTDNPIDELLSYNEQTNTLEYSSDGIIKRKEIDFEQDYPKFLETYGLNISCKLFDGIAMDYDTVLSSIKPDGTIVTQKSVLGEYLYKLKYQYNNSVVNQIAEIVKTEYFNNLPAIGSPLETSVHSRTDFFLYEYYGGEEIDILIPIPSSNPQKKDPLLDLWKEVSKLTKIPIDTKYLVKTKATPQIRSIHDKKKKEDILLESLSVIDNRYQNKNVMLLDDTYCSGSSLNIAATLLKEYGKVKKIYALTILKIRSDSHLKFSQETMKKYTITPTKDHEGNFYLDRDVQAYFHSDYSSGAGQWQIKGTVENIICTLKNDITPYTESVLQNVCNQLENILLIDLPHILRLSAKNSLIVCTIPRAKVNYNPNQLYFKRTVSKVANQLPGFIDGTNYIIRTIDTKTTHRARGGYGGNGDMPYPKITINTCDISGSVKDKDILLIDDLYTNSVNIDEDAIQALFDKGAKSVVFYSIGAKLGL